MSRCTRTDELEDCSCRDYPKSSGRTQIRGQTRCLAKFGNREMWKCGKHLVGRKIGGRKMRGRKMGAGVIWRCRTAVCSIPHFSARHFSANDSFAFFCSFRLSLKNHLTGPFVSPKREKKTKKDSPHNIVPVPIPRPGKAAPTCTRPHFPAPHVSATDRRRPRKGTDTIYDLWPDSVPLA